MRTDLAVPDWVLAGLPPVNASRVLSVRQTLGLAVLLGTTAAAMAAAPWPAFFVLNVASIAFYLVCSHYRLALQFLSVHREAAWAPLAESDPPEWPLYSVLVPLYREASALPGLVAHLASMDYPPHRLQVLLLIEEDDAETRDAAVRCRRPPFVEIVWVPPSLPRTKPKACNYGLRFARGDYLVVFDAEDRPDRDQLRKAVRAFLAASEDAVCVQAQLNFYNRDRNPLTRLFTVEYSGWFDFCLPALFLLDAPIPLGGTSNHFRRDALIRLGGWDPFNVTEDCDLGIRLYVEGKRTLCLDSTTWEEATFRPGAWIRQRSRWVKGYIQTYLVHLRQHRLLRRRMGAARTLHFHLLFGATAFCLLLNPVYWAFTALWLAFRAPWLTDLYPLWLLVPALACLLAANAAFVLSGMLACLGRGHYGLVPWCLLLPLYWVLMSVGAWKGALQLLVKPFFWEKTPHQGLAPGEAAP